MEEDYMSVYLKGVYDERDKWKSKVKEKIEELEKEIEEKQERGTDFTLIHEHEIDTNGIIQVLQELLD